MIRLALMLSAALAQNPGPAAPAGGFTDLSDFADEAQTQVLAPAPVPTMGFRDLSEFSDEAPMAFSAVAFDLLFGGVLVMAALVLLGPIGGALYLVAWRHPVVWARGRSLPRSR